MLQLPDNLPAGLAPLAWLLGVWEGTGILNYPVNGEVRNYEFGQRVSFSHDGLPHVNYSSYTWLFGADDDESFPSPLVTETGYWCLARPATESDPGPGLLAGVGEPTLRNADDVEKLRNADGGFDLEVSILHPGGVSELYLGQVKAGRIDLATDAVMRSASAKEHSASTRMYGLVENHLLWAWDIAALGAPLTSHASGRLARVD